jgi:hypothetical protein
VADYQAHIEEFKQENTDIIALSVDPLKKVQEMVERTGATFPIGYGLKVPEDADKVGAYWEVRRGIIHAIGFTIGPDQKILQACFATGPHWPDRGRGCAKLDTGNQAEESQRRYLICRSQKPAPTTSPIIRKACSTSARSTSK